MAWAKLKAGVLRLETTSGPRYLKLNMTQRLRALWIFRNFRALALHNLYGWQKELLEQLCGSNEFVSWKGIESARVIGTLQKVHYAVLVRSASGSSALDVAIADRQARASRGNW